jgi:hypothetical protein
MTEQEFRLEARLMAIEYMIANVYQVLYQLHGSSPQIVLETHRRARKMLRKQTIPGVDQAMSDLWTAELQRNVEGMLASIEEMLAKRP